MLKKHKRIVILVGFLGVGLLTIGWCTHRLAPESAPAARGAAFAQVGRCGDCYGGPANLRLANGNTACADDFSIERHRQFARDCADAMAYLETMRLRKNFRERERAGINNPLIAGERLAREYHCFQCHGYLGQGGFENAGSLKGYVPGYFGKDFKILTRNGDPESVRSWIMHGMDPEITQRPLTGPIARYFFRRQATSMPSYKSLQAAEIDILVDYVIALNSFGPMTVNDLRVYGDRSRMTGILARTSSDRSPAL
ncbi:MAG: hypothetical protein OER85_13070 [Gammaproteobacteria bacterium]|nr:hypothetical protein [Gammaproteobacteria bacterium]